MAIKKILSSALIASLITVTMGSEIMAQTVTGPVQITTATSSIPSRHPTQFPLAKIIDGISANTTPFNGFAGQSQTVGKITFTFNGHYNLTAFRLWNGINKIGRAHV